MIEHVRRLLDDSRLMIDTTNGRRTAASHLKSVSETDRGVDLKRLMTEMNVPDRELQARMPVGMALEVNLSRKQWWIFTKPVGHLKVMCVSPTRSLIGGAEPRPMSGEDVSRLLREMPPPVAQVPSTVVIVSTSGFTLDAREKVDRTTSRTIILAEVNHAGGWTVYGPSETKALNDLLDPEADAEKRARLSAAIEDRRVDLLGGGIAADKLSARTQLPIGLVETELKTYAKQHGLAAKRIDGRVVLYSEGSSPLAASAGDTGGSDMPMVDRIKSLFGLKGDTEKKIAFLSERRAALSQQRDRAYDEISALEKKDVELRDEFGKATAMQTKKRITSQLLQLRKDIERRQQMLGVFNQQLNVVSTHLHNLELVHTGTSAKLPDSEEIASDAAAAEEMLARLQADNEVADSVGGLSTISMSAEEQALFEELERESGGETPSTTKIDLAHAEPPDVDQPARQPSPPQRATPPRQRGEAEPG